MTTPSLAKHVSPEMVSLLGKIRGLLVTNPQDAFTRAWQLASLAEETIRHEMSAGERMAAQAVRDEARSIMDAAKAMGVGTVP